MKKIQALFSSTLLFICLSITSCFNPVFYEIAQDVPPLEAKVSGNILSISRYTADGEEFLLCAGNSKKKKGLRYKLASNDKHDSWEAFQELPFELHKYFYYANESHDVGHNGHQILKVLADSDTVYLITVEYTEDIDTGYAVPKKFHIFANKLKVVDSKLVSDGEWVNLTENGYTKKDKNLDYLPFAKNESDELYYTFFNVFSTNSPNTNHRKVFLRRKDSEKAQSEYFELSGKTIKPCTIVNVENNNKDINSAAFLGDELYFFNSDAISSNETATTPASIIYYGNNSKLCYFDGTNTKEVLNAGTNILSLAYTKDSLLIGRGNINSESSSTYGGITKTSVDEFGIPGETLLSFETNAESQLSTSYLILTLLAVYPEKSEIDNILYSSLSFKGSGSGAPVSYKNIGLWSYYKSRGNWNRE